MSTSNGQTLLCWDCVISAIASSALPGSALPGCSLDFVNQRFRDYTGLSSDQLYGSEWNSAVHRDDIEQFETSWQAVWQPQEVGTTEIRLRRFDRKY